MKAEVLPLSFDRYYSLSYLKLVSEEHIVIVSCVERNLHLLALQELLHLHCNPPTVDLPRQTEYDDEIPTMSPNRAEEM